MTWKFCRCFYAAVVNRRSFVFAYQFLPIFGDMKMNVFKKCDRLSFGFTLIELLVVIAIIALLLAILIPSLRKAKDAVKLVYDSNNQRQVVFGLAAYATDNETKLPPSASNQGRPGRYHRPTELNWYENQVGYSATSDYDFVGKFLGSYLPNSDVFNCPLAPIKDDAPWPPESSGLPAQGTYGEFYLNGYYTPLHSTYMLLWNYQGYNHKISGYVDLSLDHFEAPTSNGSSNKLVIQDTFFFLTSNTNMLWPSPQQSWYLSHPYKESEKAEPYHTRKEPAREFFPDVQLTAGYMDGHAERFHSSDTRHVKNFSAEAYLTRRYK